MDDIDTARQQLAQHLRQAIADDPLGAIGRIAGVQRETEVLLHDAVRQATVTASWREIAAGLGVSKQAAHRRFKAYADEVTAEIKTEHRAMKRSRRAGDAEQAAAAETRRDALIADLRSAADQLKTSV